MKMKVSRNELIRAVKVVSGGVISGATDIFSHFLFSLEDGNKLFVKSYNTRIYCSTLLGTIDIVDDGFKSFTIHSKRLKMWLSAVADDEVSIEYKGERVRAKSSSGSIPFLTLDPRTFKTLDWALADARRVAVLPANVIKDAFSYAKMFAGTSKAMPNFCVVECNDDSLFSTDRFGLVKITIDDLSGCNIRVHHKDIGSIGIFLECFGDSEIEVYEHNKGFFLVGDNGSTLGVSRPVDQLPIASSGIDVECNEWWEFDKGDMRKAVDIILSAARWKESNITVKRINSEISIMVNDPSGDDVVVTIPCSGYYIEGETSIVPDGGITLLFQYLNKILANHSSDTIRMEIVVGKRGRGIVMFKDNRSSAEYLSVICWET